MKPPSILFVIGQAGSAAFFGPLWNRWSVEGKRDWWVILRKNVGSEVFLPADVLPVDVPWEHLNEEPLEGLKPDLLVVSSTSQKAERQALLWATQRNIPTVQLVDSYYDYGKRISQTNGSNLSPDHILVSDEKAVEDAVAEGLSRDRLKGVGNPAFENIKTLPPANEHFVLFVGQPVVEDMGDTLGYDQYSALALLIEARKKYPDRIRKIVYAPHPREIPDQRLADMDVEIVQSARRVLNETGIVFGMFSTLLIETVLAGRRTISLQPGAIGPDRCEPSRRGIIPRVRNIRELAASLDSEMTGHENFYQTNIGASERLEKWFDGVVSLQPIRH